MGRGTQPLWMALRHPARLGRLAFYLEADDGASLAWWLRRWLSRPARRRLGALLLTQDDVVLAFDGGGFHWSVPTGDDLTAELLASGEYSATEVTRLTAWIRAHRDRGASTVVEAGANVGSTTLPLAREGWRVLAIEPVPKTIGFLQRNVDANGFNEVVTIAPVAITAQPGDVTMIVSFSLARSHVDGLAPGSDGERTTVRGARLDEIVEQAAIAADDIAFVWCDTEGSEEAVIASGASLWDAGVPLFAECAPAYGTGHLIDTVVKHFAAFVPEADLASVDVAPRPIKDLKAWLARQASAVNVLLLP